MTNKSLTKAQFLQKYAFFILAPYMEKEVINDKRLNYDNLIYLNISNNDEINKFLEEFLLSEEPIEQTKIYQIIKKKQNDKDYLNNVKKGLLLLNLYNTTFPYSKICFDLKLILTILINYISQQAITNEAKKAKMTKLNEYYNFIGDKLNDYSEIILSTYENMIKTK